MSLRERRNGRVRRDRTPLRDRVARPQRSPLEQWMFIFSRVTLLLVVLTVATVGAPRVARSILQLSSPPAATVPSKSVAVSVEEARRAVLRATVEAERESIRSVAESLDAIRTP